MRAVTGTQHDRKAETRQRRLRAPFREKFVMLLITAGVSLGWSHLRRIHPENEFAGQPPASDSREAADDATATREE